MLSFTFEVIGKVRSPYKEKFAVPRQPGLVADGGGELELLPPYNQPDSVRGLADFSHLWLLFVFDQNTEKSWSPTVRPPRLGGNTRLGVFATRSPFRPNPIGISLVELKHIHCKGQQVILELGSLDLVDGTPILDIKPYLPFADSQPRARGGFAAEAPNGDIPVNFTPAAEQALQRHSARYPSLRRFISQVLAQDPRPAYKKMSLDDKEYGMRLLDFNIRWRVTLGYFDVVAIDTV